jgi:sulfate permease, SulP family
MELFEKFFPLPHILRDEFKGYGVNNFRSDVIAGITVAAVALPLALAFGVASGATAAAGLVTAIVAGFLVGALSGHGYQISGPTGTMTAVLIVVASKYGIEAIWVTTLLAGLIILMLAILNLGDLVNFIPASVIVGFTSGVASIIFIGQLDNLLGVKTPAAPNALLKLFNYFKGGFTPNLNTLLLGVLVILIMVFWPKKLSRRLPGSLVAMVVVTGLALVSHMGVPTIGTIPQTIILDEHLTLTAFPWAYVGDLVIPAFSVAALVVIEALLSGAAANRMPEAERKMVNNQHLYALAAGNLIMPFFGGVPITSAFARTSMGLRSGAQTRITSWVHSFVLLLAVLLAAPLLSQIPLAVLAGVLAVTTWNMNSWIDIRNIFGRRFKTAMLSFLLTLIGTIVLDLTQAIILGVLVSAVVFIIRISRIAIEQVPVSAEKMQSRGYTMQSDASKIMVIYVVGPLFFGTAASFDEEVQDLSSIRDVVLSMRTVPLMDTTGLRSIDQLVNRLERQGGKVYLSGLNKPVYDYLERSRLLARIGQESVHWSSLEAIIAADQHRAKQVTSEPQVSVAQA